MSLAIEIDDVTAVLLSDGWHEVGYWSFTLDSYEFVCDDDLVHGGGASGICDTGFSFTPAEARQAGARISGPLTAILAVRTIRRAKSDR